MRLSIIIPLGPQDSLPSALLNSLSGQPAQVEILLAVGQRESQLAAEPARLIESPPGRGCQQNAAVGQAHGDWLWFVHADSGLPPTALPEVLNFTDRSDPGIGYCRLRFADDGPALTRLNALGANLRSRLLGLPYGDQGLCLPRECFERLGGFREDLARGEDLDLVVRARQLGLPARPMGITILTSARRYGQQGWLNTTVNHQIAAIRLIRQARRSQGSQ
jgi:hypothetical protein